MRTSFENFVACAICLCCAVNLSMSFRVYPSFLLGIMCKSSMVLLLVVFLLLLIIAILL